MNLVVCIKQVLEEPRIEIDPQNGASHRADGKRIINPMDMYALEEAIQIKEQHGGRVTVISLGPQETEEALREAIALGTDEAILLNDPAFEGSDTLATSYVLAQAIKKVGQPDIVICGRQTTDGDTGQVPPQLAEWLGLPFVSSVSKLDEIKDGVIVVHRMVDEGYEVVEMSLPGLISVVKEINEPRLPSLRGLMQAKKVQIAAWTAEDMGLDSSKVGLTGSAIRPVRVFFPERTRQGEMLEGSAEDQVDTLLEKLKQSKAI